MQSVEVIEWGARIKFSPQKSERICTDSNSNLVNNDR
jgi:hypothetical protein